MNFSQALKDENMELKRRVQDSEFAMASLNQKKREIDEINAQLREENTKLREQHAPGAKLDPLVESDLAIMKQIRQELLIGDSKEILASIRQIKQSLKEAQGSELARRQDVELIQKKTQEANEHIARLKSASEEQAGNASRLSAENSKLKEKIRALEEEAE